MAKTDEKPRTSMPISADMLADIGQNIASIDTRIASSSGNETQARKAFVEGIVAKHSETASSTADNLVEQLRQQDPEMLVALLYTIQQTLSEELSPVVDGWVADEFPKTQSDAKEDVAKLREERKTLVGHFKAMRELLTAFGVPNDHVPDPKRVGGGRPPGSGTGESAKSGRNKEGYRYIIDGKEQPGSQNSFSAVAYHSTVGVPKALDPNSNVPRWGAKDLKNFIAEHGVKWGDDDTWEVELPNGKKVGARRLTPEDLISFGIDPSESEETEGEAEAA